MDAKLIEQLNTMDALLENIEDASLRAMVQFFKNALEQAYVEIQTLREENQRLRDEVNRLKGEQGKPVIRPQTQDGDISSETERATPKKRARKKKAKKRR